VCKIVKGIKSLLIIILFYFPLSFAYAEDGRHEEDISPVQFGAFFLKDEGLLEVNLDDPAHLVEWTKETNSRIRTILDVQESPMDVVIQVNLYTDGPADVSFSSRPKSDLELEASLRRSVQADLLPQTKIVDFSYRLYYRVNGGVVDKKERFVPALSDPYAEVLLSYRQADIKKKLFLLKSWAKEEVLPVLAAFCQRADMRFEGVHQIGNMLGGLEYWKRMDVESLTYENPEFWQGMLEMSPGNPLVSSVLVFLYVANEEMDKARRLTTILLPFAIKDYVPASYLHELEMRLNSFYEDVQKEIRKGVDLHDDEKYESAINNYEMLLKDYPFSAWANYELFYTMQMKNIKENRRNGEKGLWISRRDVVYGCDPLYPAQFSAKGNEEMFELTRRRELQKLFKDKENQKKDVVTYADIALDLQSYGFAALLYQYILQSFDKEVYGEKDILTHFLYCLDKLGITQIKSHFKGDFEKGFKKIDKNREELMKKNAA